MESFIPQNKPNPLPQDKNKGADTVLGFFGTLLLVYFLFPFLSTIYVFITALFRTTEVISGFIVLAIIALFFWLVIHWSKKVGRPGIARGIKIALLVIALVPLILFGACALVLSGNNF